MENIMTSDVFRKKLNTVREQIFVSIRRLMKQLGGKVCFRMYHDYNLIDNLYTFFMVDRDGYGVALHLDTASTRDDIEIVLTDNEDCYEETWELAELNVVDALYMLEELENIADFHELWPDKPVLTEYDPDFDPDNY